MFSLMVEDRNSLCESTEAQASLVFYILQTLVQSIEVQNRLKSTTHQRTILSELLYALTIDFNRAILLTPDLEQQMVTQKSRTGQQIQLEEHNQKTFGQ